MQNFAKLIAAAALATVWIPAPAESAKRVDKGKLAGQLHKHKKEAARLEGLAK